MGNSKSVLSMEADDRNGSFYKDTNIQSSGSVHLGNNHENNKNHYGDNNNHYGDNNNHYGDNKNHYGDNKNHYGSNHYNYYASPPTEYRQQGSRRPYQQQARPEAQKAQYALPTSLESPQAQPASPAARGARRGSSNPEVHPVVEVMMFGPGGYIKRFNKQSKIRAVLEPGRIKLYNMPRTDLQPLGDRVPKADRPLKGTCSGHIVLANGSKFIFENVSKSSTRNGWTVLVGGNLAGTN